MQKLLAVLLAVTMLCLPVFALAEDDTQAEETYRLYENEAFGYSVSVPTDWQELSDENLQNIIDLSGSLSDSEALKAALESAKASNIAFFYTADFTGNINISANDASIFTSTDVFLQYKDTLLETFLAQYKQMDPDATCEASDELMTAGDNEYFAVSVSLTSMGIPIQLLQCLTVLGDKAFTVTFSDINAVSDSAFYVLLSSLAIN